MSPEEVELLKQVKSYGAKTILSIPPDLKIVKSGVAQTKYDALMKATSDGTGVNKKRFHIPGITYYVSVYRLESGRVIRVDSPSRETFFYIAKFIRKR